MIVKRKSGKTMNSVMKWMPYKIGVIDQKITDSCSLGKNKMDGWMEQEITMVWFPRVF